jgi:hypothetical protein
MIDMGCSFLLLLASEMCSMQQFNSLRAALQTRAARRSDQGSSGDHAGSEAGPSVVTRRRFRPEMSTE